MSARASHQELATLSRNVGTALYSGVPVVRCFEMAAGKSSGRLRTVLLDVVSELKSGSDIASAIDNHSHAFPPLFRDMVRTGEEAGALPEVLKSLAKHYEANVRLRKEFVSQIALPVVQLVIAVLIVAALIFLLGYIGSLTGQTFDILGWGLLGASGAALWLGGWVMGIAAAVIVWKLLNATLAGKKILHQFLMALPVVGHCLRSFAIARFSWAFALTQQAGMDVVHSLKSSLRATSNGVFIAATDQIVDDVKNGESLTDALRNSRLFPVEYIETCLVAETSGTVPEALDRLSPQFEDDARRSLQTLSATLGWVIWLAVAAFIITIIFTIAIRYIGLINSVLQDANR